MSPVASTVQICPESISGTPLIGEYIENYNYRRPHQGIGNMMPADRYFQVAKQVEKAVA